MHQKDRAINLGLKINSLKGNLSVAQSVIKDLEVEITSAKIDEEDKERLLTLYYSVVKGLKSVVSPSISERNRINQLIEDANDSIKKASNYIEVDNIEGSITFISEQLTNKNLKKEHKAALKTKIVHLQESQRRKAGLFLKRNFEKLLKEINSECDCESPYHISVLIKDFNNKVKTTPTFRDDRHELPARP